MQCGIDRVSEHASPHSGNSHQNAVSRTNNFAHIVFIFQRESNDNALDRSAGE